MSNYPVTLDDDSSIPRVDDNITEIGATVINQLREAVFALEQLLGIAPATDANQGPGGSAGSVAARLFVSMNADGSIRQSALNTAGVLTGPISNADVASNAQIAEAKLALAYTTNALYNMIQSAVSNLDSNVTLSEQIKSDFIKHISGTYPLSNSLNGRHVVSQIDINTEASDARDTSFSWPSISGVPTAPRNRLGALRGADGGNLAAFLLDLNNDLVRHQKADGVAHLDNSADQYGHTASGISLDTSTFVVAPKTANNVQKFSEFVDKTNFLAVTTHQQDDHSNGVPRTCRGAVLDNSANGKPIVPVTTVTTYLLLDGYNGSPQDNNVDGDDIIEFFPTSSTTFKFDASFAGVRAGDIVTVFYEAATVSYLIDSVNYSFSDDGLGNANSVSTKYLIRINGRNLMYSTAATARIDRPLYNENTQGVLALAQANNTFGKLGTLIVGDPRGASVLGLGFDPSKFSASHYYLYLQIFPTGNPDDKVISLPAIDVTGNRGKTPGKYTLDSIVEATNNSFRKPGFNYRFIAFQQNGEFGIMLADSIGKASFSITNGTRDTTGVLTSGIFVQNVIGDSNGTADPLGFGTNGANVAGSVYKASYSKIIQAQFPTIIFAPLANRNYYANGVRRSQLAQISDGYSDLLGDTYWEATLTQRIVVPGQTSKAVYSIPLDLSNASLAPGKTILIQPQLTSASPSYVDSDYGRFIIEDVSFTSCGSVVQSTTIRVYNAVYGRGQPLLAGVTDFPVRIYFSNDSVAFDKLNIVDASSSDKFKRYFEVFADSTGHTYTHERARFNQTTENAQIAILNVVKVSPKLRGYTTATNRKILLTMTYNSDNTFTANLSDLSGTSALGPTVTGKKGSVARLYDETNIDYIDIVFDIDESVTAFAAVMLTIDLFPSLQLNQEGFFLGSCVVNDNTSKILHLKDGREFGGVSEKDFSNSAIDYVTAGNRLLDQNGVVRGFDYVATSANSMSFRGGVALVNGKLLDVNNFVTYIPYIKDYNNGSPATTVVWAICVTSLGQIKPYPVSDYSSGIYYNITTTEHYPIETVSLDDLQNNRRKDLLVLYYVTAVVTSATAIALTYVDNRKASVSLGARGILPQAVLTYAKNTVSIVDAKTLFKNIDLTRFNVVQNSAGNITIWWAANVLLPTSGAPAVSQTDDVEIDRIRAFYTTYNGNSAVQVKTSLATTPTDANFIITIY